MKATFKNKKKVVALAIALCILLVSVTGITLAYFTDNDTATNTYTAGNIKIKLTELDITGAAQEFDGVTGSIIYNDVFPTQTISKDVTVTNVSTSTGGDNAQAYVAAIINISCTGATPVSALLPDETAVKAFITGGALADSANFDTLYVVDSDAITVYVLAKATVAKDASVVIFENMNIPGEWDNADMTTFQDLEVNINAYATQSFGFSDYATAIETVFGDEATDPFKPYFDAIAP